MRQWHVDPRLLCRRHLLGEHVEQHMFFGTWRLGKSLRGYIERGLVEVATIPSRHDALAAEMIRRGMKHASPLAAESELPVIGRVDAEANLKELARRCPDCRARQLLAMSRKILLKTTEEVL